MRPVGGGAPASLARFGFADPRLAAQLLGPGQLGWWHPQVGTAGDDPAAEVVAALARADDPDLAVRALHRLVAAQDAPEPLRAAVAADDGLRDRLIGVLGASAALGDHLVANPGEWALLSTGSWEPARPSPGELRRTLLDAVGADPDAEPTWGSGGVRAERTGPAAVAALRRAYRRSLLVVAARDVTVHSPDGADVAAITAELADLAAATLGAALAVAAAELPARAAPARLAVIGMGKCGGHELNYVSDVDVIFVAEPAGEDVEVTAALRTATALASTMMRICQVVAWPVDAALRPEGKDGPLVRTLASHEAYYRQWARTWEFQALLKARPVAGDAELGRRWMDAVTPLVWHAADRPGVVNDVRAMRRRVEESLPARDAEREIKLGPGGLRDIEFAVQLLQLVHGPNDESLRSGSTLDAVRALTDGGYVGRTDGEALDHSYRFLRRIEHRLQLQRLRRTHRLPDDEHGLRWLAQALGFRGDARAGAVERFTAEWSRHAREVRRLHEKLFYRPLLEAAATVSGDTLRLSPDSARARLEVLGFADPAGALRHIEALTAGVSRRAALQRALLPTILATFADAPDPDAGLLAYRKVSDRLGQTPWYLRLLRDEGLVAVRFATLLGTSRYAADLLGGDPEGLRLLASEQELVPRTPEALRGVLGASVQRHTENPAAGVVAARALRRRELLRIASADLLGFADTVTVGQALSDVTDAVLDAALETAVRAVTRARGGDPLPARLAVIGMGRLGGAELSYSSDADVMFVHEPVDGASDADAAAAAAAVAEEMRRMLAAPAPDPPVGLDTTLRPEGRQGPPTRSLASYAEYYRRWSQIWEAQALLRARPCAGDAELAGRFMALVDPLRYPAEGLTPAQVVEIRRIKARVDAERLPRGADPATHVKLGRGGLADVEWTVQLLQLQHAAEIKPLRTPRTLEALTAARDAGLVNAADHDALAAAWLLATRVRNAIMLVRGRPSDQLPRRGPELLGVARVLGGPPGGDPGEFVDEYLRTMRRGRLAVERVFYA
jgi:glutamate-ammonia-ligase adenylyltransferase